MSNGRRLRRRTYRSPEGRRSPHHYRADELHTLLVEDAVKGHPTDLEWAVQAYIEIAKQRRQKIDQAFEDVRSAVWTLGKTMPV